MSGSGTGVALLRNVAQWEAKLILSQEEEPPQPAQPAWLCTPLMRASTWGMVIPPPSCKSAATAWPDLKAGYKNVSGMNGESHEANTGNDLECKFPSFPS